MAINDFKKQIEYFRKYYQIITMEELFEAIYDKRPLKDNSLILTFDDGYIEHFTVVFPILDELNIQGSFFPSARALNEKRILDVNKIHYILAAQENTKIIIKDIFSYLDQYREQFGLNKNKFYYQQYAQNDCYDTKDTIFIKRILQCGLPNNLREIIINALFEKYLQMDESILFQETYMNIEQLKMMKRKGMHIGNHGYDHLWMNKLHINNQKSEILKSLKYFNDNGINMDNWVFSYPYGAVSESLIDILKNNGCKMALTTRSNIADICIENIYQLPRLDTNEMPVCKEAHPIYWTQIVMQ